MKTFFIFIKMSSDETTTSNKLLLTTREQMGYEALTQLERLELLKLIAATFNALHGENRTKYKDIALHPYDLYYAINHVGNGVGRIKDINEMHQYLRIGEDIIHQLDHFKAYIQVMIKNILWG